jgi:hypothetical protein
MTEERKHAILFAATILLARKLQPMLEVETADGVIEHYQWRTIHQVSRLLEKIDQRWPAEAKTEAAL